MKTLYEEMVGHIAYMMRDNHMGIELNWNGIRKAKLKRDESKIKIEIKNEHKFLIINFFLIILNNKLKYIKKVTPHQQNVNIK